MELKEAKQIIKNAKEVHAEFIGDFISGEKLCLDGWFVIDEIEAILTFMKHEKCKKSHDRKYGR